MRQATGIVIMVGNLFVCNLAIATNWYLMYENDEYSIYIENENMKIQGDKVSYWERLEFKKPEKLKGKPYFATVAYKTSDCEERMSGVTQLVAHDKEGKVVYSFDYPLDMSPVAPNSVGEIILEQVCDLKSIRGLLE